MNPRPIRFFHRGEIVAVDGVPPTQSVLDWLRGDARRVGTKEGCNEGDCGACTVVVGELPRAGDDRAVRGLALATVNACLCLLPALDGKALYTVEDLKTIAVPSGTLHPVQQALVDCHASQCGFCTPGFAMSLWSVYEHHTAVGTRPSRRELADALSGNLCRCTGYRPILDAGRRMFDLPPVALDTRPAVAALERLAAEQRDATFDYEAPNPAAAGRIDRWHAPRTVAALAALRLERPDARLVAGTTDVGLWITKRFRDVGAGELIHVGAVDELKRIDESADGRLTIGAAAPLEAGWRALVRRHPAIADVWLRFASPPIRNAGTMGGNVANGSPIGDSAPVLIAVDAEIALRRGDRVRTLPLDAFYVGYMTNRLEPGEFALALHVPPTPPGMQLRAYKISKRFDCDISAVCAAFAITLDGDRIVDARLAWGGMAAIVRRSAGAEAALVGSPWDEAALRRAQAALDRDFTPLSDMRASAAYRMQVAQNLLERFWLETRPEGALPPDAIGVWAALRQAGV